MLFRSAGRDAVYEAVVHGFRHGLGDQELVSNSHPNSLPRYPRSFSGSFPMISKCTTGCPMVTPFRAGSPAPMGADPLRDDRRTARNSPVADGATSGFDFARPFIRGQRTDRHLVLAWVTCRRGNAAAVPRRRVARHGPGHRCRHVLLSGRGLQPPADPAAGRERRGRDFKRQGLGRGNPGIRQVCIGRNA